MNIYYKLLVLAVSVTGVLSFTGCNKTQENASMPATGTTVGTEIDDSIITTKVKSKLLADQDIKGFDLKVETHKGDVLLSGFVDNQAQIDHAIMITRSVEGVKNVDNKVGLKSNAATTMGVKVDDSIVTSKVKSSLLADPDIKSLDIAVVTNNGEVQLSGFVNNQTQIDHAMDVARRTEGVHNVINELRIKQ
ncbi:MAG: BON domain-containing protein [Candidatus Nitrotoga sp.]|nr:BON domain-containing protein [Candidatus Nitrotoga sp.]MDO9446890.1 BON domain-containing protein [Candidatus Nitrotoga sp.]MDP1637869.1 BON domain-containing protein [Candidatus Nitrotoga sp.]MDP1855017.1 BON domain-containing protein [Candidatus Nitrotoga sp.]MDP3497210.1 BON domain-containing protein [Candidatus Nitrotoga sp.]